MNKSMHDAFFTMLAILIAFSISNDAFAKRHRRHHKQSKQTQDNFENGLCVEKNRDRVQASGKSNYCTMLKGILDDPKSCAHQEIANLTDASSSASGQAPSIDGMGQFCANYSSLDSGTDFYYQLLSVMVYTESRWSPKATGDGGRSKGLLQISLTDAGSYSDCKNLTAKNIFDPYTNLKCGSCIAMKNLARDRSMGSGHAGTRSSKGLARYFGPFGDTSRVKRTIASATNQFCEANGGNNQNATDYASIGGDTPTRVAGRVHMASAAPLAHASH